MKLTSSIFAFFFFLFTHSMVSCSNEVKTIRKKWRKIVEENLGTATSSPVASLIRRKPRIPEGLPWNCQKKYERNGLWVVLEFNMADEEDQNVSLDLFTDHDTVCKQKYFTLLKHCRQIEQVMYATVLGELTYLEMQGY